MLLSSTESHTLRDLLNAYASEKLPTLAKETQRQYRSYHRRLREEIGGMLLSEITPSFLRQWRDTLLVTYPPGTVKIYLALLSAPLTMAVKELDWLDHNPMQRITQPKNPRGRVRFLSPEERTRLLTACAQSHNPHLYAVVVLALATGARKSELLHLRWADVDLTQGSVFFAYTKNGDDRTVPVRGEALTMLRARGARQSPERWVFPREDGQKPLYIDKAWQVACRRAKLTNFRFHDCRHTAASYLVMSGASLLEVAEILGHRSLDMTKRYSHMTVSHTAGVLERMTSQFLE